MISKYTTVFFPYTTIIPYHFLYGHRLFHLDNPDPVETETISNPIQIQKIPNLRPNRAPKSGSCIPLMSLVRKLGSRAVGNIAVYREKSDK